MRLKRLIITTLFASLLLCSQSRAEMMVTGLWVGSIMALGASLILRASMSSDADLIAEGYVPTQMVVTGYKVLNETCKVYLLHGNEPMEIEAPAKAFVINAYTAQTNDTVISHEVLTKHYCGTDEQDAENLARRREPLGTTNTIWYLKANSTIWKDTSAYTTLTTVADICQVAGRFGLLLGIYASIYQRRQAE